MQHTGAPKDGNLDERLLLPRYVNTNRTSVITSHLYDIPAQRKINLGRKVRTFQCSILASVPST